MKTLRMPVRLTALPIPAVSTGQLMALTIMLGLTLRLYHLLCFRSTWHDEAVVFLCAIQLNFRELLGPLIHHEAAPPLFLVIERLMFLTFGDTLLTFRAMPFVASSASLLLLASIAWRLLPPWPAVLATALYAVSDKLLMHSVEAKPYAVDAFLATAIIWFYLRTESWSLQRRCLAGLALFPVAVWLSFPVCFMLGGWFLAQMPVLLRSRSSAEWLTAIALAGTVGVSFLALVVGPIAAQRDASMESCWPTAFADWSRPWTVPIWAVRSTFDILGHSVNPQGWLLVSFIVVGSVVVRRQHGPRLLTLLLAPLGLTFVAGLLGKYPYCGQRVLMFIAPAVCLLAAAGVPATVAYLRQPQPRALPLVWLVLALPFINGAVRIGDPWKRPDNNSAQALVLAHWQPGDRLGFNNWEAEYRFRLLHDAWIQPGEVILQGPQRLWYVAVSPEKGVRDTVIRGIPPVWQVQQRWEFAEISVLLMATDSADATASHIPMVTD